MRVISHVNLYVLAESDASNFRLGIELAVEKGFTRTHPVETGRRGETADAKSAENNELLEEPQGQRIRHDRCVG
jgi:hypothetical protein